jgi:hypothetical protein
MKLMSRIAKWQLLLVALLLGPLLGQQAHAQTINAASCSASDVQTALNSVATDGTTVNIPAGSCTWSTQVTYNGSFSATIQGQSTTNGTCGPGGSCSATDSTVVSDATSTGTALQVHSVNGKSIRVTGITFSWGSGAQEYNGMLNVDGNTQSVRVDHCHFVHANIVDLIVGGSDGNMYGVIDHNLFNTINSDEDAFRTLQSNWNGVANSPGYMNDNGNGSWADSSHWGSNQFIFLENNNFVFDGASSTWGFAYDCIAEGGRMVFRYNVLTNSMRMQTHGTGSGDTNYRSCRAIEMYGNALTYAPQGSTGTINANTIMQFEGGGLLSWGNTFTGYESILQIDTIRQNSETYTQSAPPSGWGYCGTEQTGSSSVWDQNTKSTGYKCLDQFGVGKGDLLSGNFPNKIDSATGKASWPNQAYDPGYLWGNTFNAVNQNPNAYVSTTPDSVENVAYFLQLPNINESSAFNGTAGVGCGPSTGTGCASAVQQPSTCTQFTGYWNPSTSTLYQCNPANTWATYYTPFTYPHPLIAGGQTTGNPPAPPTNLAASVQ